VNARLDALTRTDGKTPLDNPTKNRYRAAVSSFAKYLVKLDLLESNFVRDIEGYGENDPRMVYYERADAKRLIAALPQPFAGISAFACGFCAEWAAVEQLTVADVDLTRARSARSCAGPRRRTGAAGCRSSTRIGGCSRTSSARSPGSCPPRSCSPA
jgi:hypothetical protein